MYLSPQQCEQFNRDGYLVFPDLFSRPEVDVLRREVARMSTLDCPEVVREHTGGARTIFRVHEDDGVTHSEPFRALVRTPRVLRPVRQVLGSDEVYVYHTKINTKPAIEGTVWQWHQDYGSWMRDGCPRPDMATFNITMTDTTEMGGALYIIPGSHKLGRIEPYFDESTAYKFWAIPKQRMIEVLKNSPPPIALVGRAGMGVLFHCNTLHASAHNLSAEDRWHIYISCNTVANAPRFGPDSRPDWVVSRNTRALQIGDDAGVLDSNSGVHTAKVSQKLRV